VIIALHIPFAAVGGIVLLSLREPARLHLGGHRLHRALGHRGAQRRGAGGAHRAEEMRAGKPTREAALDAARARLRPVSTTALVASFGFVPMMLATGVGSEVQRPLATVVVGGLVTSTFTTLIVMPALYPWLAGKSPRRAERPADEGA
jgi:cobalt-zinc-cadmium resistance protein CzcA